MNYTEIKQKLIECIEESGITILEDGTLEDIDSLKFISCIVEIERIFEIEFPDDLLLIDYFLDIDSLSKIILNIIEENHSKENKKNDKNN